MESLFPLVLICAVGMILAGWQVRKKELIALIVIGYLSIGALIGYALLIAEPNSTPAGFNAGIAVFFGLPLVTIGAVLGFGIYFIRRRSH